MEKTQNKNNPSPSGQQIAPSLEQARFFVIHRKEGDFSAVSPFLIHKCLMSLVGELKSVKKIRSGDLLVEVFKSEQASILVQCSSLGNIPVVVSAHGSLNFSRGVISVGELFNVPEDEILEGLRDQQVCAVRRITIRRDGKTLNTKHIILTFDSPSLPSYVKAGYLRCPVRPFIPNPLRCFQCQRYGHSKMSCRGSLACPRCAEVGHDGTDCKSPLKCVNCKGDHPAYERTCPKWIFEKEVQVIKVKENLTYQEARKRIDVRTPRAGFSYAAAVKECRTIATQTEKSPHLSNSPTQTTSNYYSCRPRPSNMINKPLSVQSVIAQKPLNEHLPKSKLKFQTQPMKPSSKKLKSTPSSPTKHKC